MAEQSEYLYDLFVSYSQADEAWVRGELLPRLERAPFRYIDQLQFELGRPRLDEIERAITTSRRTLLVLSRAYLESNWRMYDSILVGSYGLEMGEWRAIPVIVEPCELPNRLRALVSVDLSAADERAWAHFVDRLASRPQETAARTGEPIPAGVAPTVAPASEQGAARQAYLTHLRQLLTTQFDAEELRTLSRALGVEYDNLRGEGRTNKARELVAYLERRGRIPRLVVTCAQQRPHAPWESRPEVAPAAGREPGTSRFVSQGLGALAELIRQAPGVRSDVVAFRTKFEAARQQIDTVDDYKQVHDLLHRLQFHCYNPIVQEARRFPEDDIAIENLGDHRITLEEIIHELRRAAERAPTILADPSCIPALVEARESLRTAIDELNADALKRARWLLGRVLAVQPVPVNARLNAAARALRLPALVEAMACISDHLGGLDLDPGKVGQFEDGVDALVSLDDSLTILVDDHDRWQAVDAELRRIEATLGYDTEEIQMSWPDLQARTAPLHSGSTEEWADSFRKESHRLHSALADKDQARIRNSFRCYRRRAGNRFHNVDVVLKRLCEDLRHIGDPLATVMGVLE
jgi:hypothetical protein